MKTLGLVVGTLNVEEVEIRPEKLLMPKVAEGGFNVGNMKITR